MGKKLIGVPHSIKELGVSENFMPIASQNLYAIDWNSKFYHGLTHVEPEYLYERKHLPHPVGKGSSYL